MSKDKKLVLLLAGILAGIFIGVIIIGSGYVDARRIKEYQGELMCTTYHVSDNTPAGTRETCSGARATEYRTIAVDSQNPRFKQGTHLYVEGFGDGFVEDVGDFGRYGVDLDLFTPENDGYKKPCKVWVLRPETKKEKKERLAKERKKRQRGAFKLVYDSSLLPWQIITDPAYIKGGTVQIGVTLCDVVDTEKGLKDTIKIGYKPAYFGIWTRLGTVYEEAVG